MEPIQDDIETLRWLCGPSDALDRLVAEREALMNELNKEYALRVNTEAERDRLRRIEAAARVIADVYAANMDWDEPTALGDDIREFRAALEGR